VKNSLPQRTRRAIDLSREKGASSWFTVIPCKDMDFDLNKREFRDAIRLRYDWAIPDSPSVCVCGCYFSAMICQHGGLVIIQRHNEIRDLEAELLEIVCHDVEIEPCLQPITGEDSTEVQTKPRMHALTYIAVGFGKGTGPHFSIFGYVTQMRTRTKKLPQNRSISCTKMKRRGSTGPG